MRKLSDKSVGMLDIVDSYNDKNLILMENLSLNPNENFDQVLQRLNHGIALKREGNLVFKTGNLEEAFGKIFSSKFFIFIFNFTRHWII